MIRISWLNSLLVALTVLTLAQNASAGWPFFSEDGLRRGTPEYYSARAGDPPGARQRFSYGKIWPVSPRPAGPSQTFVHKYHTAHYWPHPYQCLDRQSVRTVMDLQVSNGWKTATTFYDYHFDSETNELNSAGHAHAAWMVHQVPEQHRQAYVANAADAALSAARMMAVEESISRQTNGQIAIPVALRHAQSLGRPAQEVQQILNGAAEAAPAPTIEYQSVNTGG